MIAVAIFSIFLVNNISIDEVTDCLSKENSGHSVDNKEVVISISQDYFNANDSFSLQYWDFIIGSTQIKSSVSHILHASGGHRYFHIRLHDSAKAFYFTIKPSDQKYNAISKAIYLAEPGDSIVFQLSKDSFLIKGRGAGKNVCYNDMVRAIKLWENRRVDSLGRIEELGSTNRSNMGIVERFIDANVYEKEKINQGLMVLEKCKESMSSNAYSLLRIDLLARSSKDFVHAFSLYYKMASGQIKDSVKRQMVHDQLVSIYNNNLITFSAYSDDLLALSKEYVSYAVEEATYSNILNRKDGFAMLKSAEVGELRDKMLTYYFIRNVSFKYNTGDLIKEVLPTIVYKPCKELLSEMYDNLTVVSKAYNFSLPDIKNNIVELDRFRGNVVIIDFWFTGCSGCVSVARNMERVISEFKGNKIVFVSISIDGSKDVWQKSVASGLYTNKNSVNLYTNGYGADHPMLKYYFVNSFPRIIIIDKKGLNYNTNPPLPTNNANTKKFVNILRNLVALN